MCVCVCECVPSQSLPILTRARSSCEIPKQQSTFLYQFKPILDKHRSFGDQRLFHQQTLEFQPFFLYIVPGVAVAKGDAGSSPGSSLVQMCSAHLLGNLLHAVPNPQSHV